jgi:hypothetical protein
MTATALQLNDLPTLTIRRPRSLVRPVNEGDQQVNGLAKTRCSGRHSTCLAPVHRCASDRRSCCGRAGARLVGGPSVNLRRRCAPSATRVLLNCRPDRGRRAASMLCGSVSPLRGAILGAATLAFGRSFRQECEGMRRRRRCCTRPMDGKIKAARCGPVGWLGNVGISVPWPRCTFRRSLYFWRMQEGSMLGAPRMQWHGACQRSERVAE